MKYIADRIRRLLIEKHMPFTGLKMMEGLLVKTDNKMFCGIHIDKKYEDGLLMARIGETAYETEIGEYIIKSRQRNF